MNYLDLAVIGIIVFMAITCYFRGFIKTLFHLLSMVITFGLTYYLYPYVSKFVMTKTGWYENLASKISNTFDFSNLLEDAVTKEAQIEAIKAMPLPETFKNILTTNNNPEMFKLLNVSSFTEYISGTLASIAINIIVFILLFIIIWIVLTLLVNVLDLFSKLPFLNQINKLAGAVLGVVFGLAFVFVGFSVLSLIMATNTSTELVSLLEESKVALYLYNNNPIMDLLNNNISNNYFWKIIAK